MLLSCCHFATLRRALLLTVLTLEGLGRGHGQWIKAIIALWSRLLTLRQAARRVPVRSRALLSVHL